jgi:hypothetical protein
MRTTILIPAIVLIVAGITFAQSEPKAIKFAEFGPISQRGVKAKMDSFFDEIRKGPLAQGYIITYGSPKAVSARRKQITNSIMMSMPEDLRLTFIDGGFEKAVRTVIWIVPAGAEPPTP